MKISRTARRYAQAIFELARDKNEIDRWLSDLRLLSAVVSVPETAAYLGNPEIDLALKETVLGAVLPDIGPLAGNMVRLLVMKNRVDVVPSVFTEYEELVDEYRGRVRAEVVTAVAVEDGEKPAIENWLGKITGKQVVVSYLVDAAIMGGLVARVGDRLIDGSVRTRLESLKKSLLGAAS